MTLSADNSSGQSVVVPDVTQTTPPPSDLDSLVKYISGRFNARDQELVALHRNAASLKLKGDLVELGFAAIDFRRELSGWIAMARRVRDERLGDELDQAHSERTQEAQAQDLKRANAEMVKARARQQVAPLNEAIERMESARDEMVGIVSWCQSLQRSIRDEEFGSVMESNSEIPETMFSAPIGAAMNKLTR